MARASNWLTVADFTPGIFADNHVGSASTADGSVLQNGAASIDGTYRCTADQTGALVPLPKAVTTQSSTCLPAGNGNVTSSFYPANFQGAYLMDAAVIGPIGGNGSVPQDMRYSNGEDRIDVYTMYQFFYRSDGSGNNWYNQWLGRVWHQWTGTTNDFMWESSYPSTISNTTILDYSLLSGNLEPIRTVGTGAVLPLTVDRLYEAIAGVVRRNMSGRATAAIPANELLLTTFETDVSGNFPSGINTYPAGFAFVCPSPSAQFTLQSYVIPETTETPQLIFGHQDRTAFVSRTAVKANNQWIARDAVHYRAPIDAAGIAILNGSANTQYGGENTATIGVVASTNTDELLLVKHTGGGVLIRGDLKSGTAVRLRNIASTYGITSSPVNTTIGLVYGGRYGVYLWNGGTTTEKISQQIDGFFWQCGTEPYEGHRARFGFYDPWVAVPNNYLFDTRSKAWWRLSDPADRGGIPYNVYITDPTTGKLLAFPYKLTGTQNVVYDTFDQTVLTSSYSWRSQPLVETFDAVSSFQEVRIVASPGSNTAKCTVSITLTGYDQHGAAIAPVTVSFDFTGSGEGSPVIRQKALGPAFNAMYVRMQISASATTGAAPKIHSVQLGKGETRGNLPMDG